MTDMQKYNHTKNCIDKIFYDLQKYNFNYDKKILIFTENERQEINLNDYMFFFIQTINLENAFNLNFSQNQMWELTLQKCFLDYLKNKVNVDNIIIEKMAINFKKTDIQLSTDFFIFVDAFSNENNTINSILHDYCKYILHKLYVEGNILYCSILTLYTDLTNGHAVNLIILKNVDKLQLFIYDPSNAYSDNHNIQNLLYILKNCFEINNYNYFDSCEIISYENINTPSFNIQTMFEVNKNYGYCLIFSLFFLYCFLVIFQTYPEKNFSILKDIQLYFIQKYLSGKYSKIGSEKVYFSVVCFANNIKEIFLSKLGKYKIPENVLNRINEMIIYLYKKETIEKNIFTKSNTNYLLKNNSFEDDDDIYGDYIPPTKRNYDEELSLLDWSTMKELRENEDCKENNQCISKICRHNKCTRPTPNDKLDFLSKLEWDQL